MVVGNREKNLLLVKPGDEVHEGSYVLSLLLGALKISIIK